jgi:hypothetical protein
MYNITYVSDLDYSYNSETKEFDLPAVEWENWNGRWWQTFSSEEARTKALDENERINNQPHIKAQIEIEKVSGDIQYHLSDVFSYLEWKMECSERVEFSNVICLTKLVGNSSENEACLLNVFPHVHKALKEQVLWHNKALMSASRVKPTTYTLGDLF